MMNLDLNTTKEDIMEYMSTIKKKPTQNSKGPKSGSSY